MRAKELADLTGTTVRTVRHYHDIGLLAVPEDRYGYRDYDLTHVARLSRIRWLAQAGVPLSRIDGMLQAEDEAAAGSPDAGRAAIVTDLQATVVALDDQLEQLTAQRERVRRLVETVERNDHLSPMPPVVARFYDDLEKRAGDDKVRRAIRRERDFMELAFYRGDMPSEVEIVYEGFDDVRRADSLAVFGQIADRDQPGHPPTAAQIQQIVSAVAARLDRHLGAELPRVARSIDPDIARRAADLYVRLAGDRERPMARALADAVLEILEEARSR
jgi:DNA-binding transcriptional MerR regulator